MPPKRIARKVTQMASTVPVQASKARKAKAKAKISKASVVAAVEKSEVEKPEERPQSSTNNTLDESPGANRRGRKRKSAIISKQINESNQSLKSTASGRSRFRLTVNDFLPKQFGTRVLSCGEGEQLGHPGRLTTKKPRAIDNLPSDKQIVQVAAGGVHSLILFDDGCVYTCGINEKGTVPGEGVEPEGSTDQFKMIRFDNEIALCGKIVMLTAGASFSAALTEKGSVIAWGNLRGTSGCIESHKILLEMEKRPVIIVRHQHRVIVKIAAGENHLVMLSENGEMLTFGDGSMGQLGRSTRVAHIRSQHMVDDSGDSLKVSVRQKSKTKLVVFEDIMAGGFWSAARSAADGIIYVCGLNNYGQLGLEVVVNKKAKIETDQSEPELRVMRPIEAIGFGSSKLLDLSGIQHIIALDENGCIHGIGKNTDNALGIDTWSGKDDMDHWKYSDMQKIDLSGHVVGISASLGCSLAWTNDGAAYSWGYDSSGQLGLGIKADDDIKIVPRPRKITSAHLDGFQIINASIADNHALFLAKNA